MLVRKGREGSTIAGVRRDQRHERTFVLRIFIGVTLVFMMSVQKLAFSSIYGRSWCTRWTSVEYVARVQTIRFMCTFSSLR